MSIFEKKLREYQQLIGTNIKRFRTEQELSQLDLAVMCNLEKTAISRIENGRTNLTLKTALILSDALEIEVVDLFKKK